MTLIKLQTNREWLKQLGIRKIPEARELIKLGEDSKIDKFVIGTVDLAMAIEKYSSGVHLIIFDAEPDFMGCVAEKCIIDKLNEYGERITFFTANQDLQGISESIIPLTFEQLDRFRSPQSKLEWKFATEDKVKNISMLYSAKMHTTGHVIRKYIYEKYKDSGLIDFFLAEKGDHRTHLENRKISLKNYRYNLIIENTFTQHHVSDQLKDSFIGKCIPIYLGNATKYTDLYEDQWGIDWNGVIEIKSEGLEAILKRVGEKEYKEMISTIEHNSLCMKKRQLSLGWDGKNLDTTDISWLGRLIIKKTINRLKRQNDVSTHANHHDT